MSIVVVGSIALDTIETPYGKREEILGGSAIYFAAAASFFTSLKVVGVVGQDFPNHELHFLTLKGVNFMGLKKINGKTFRWTGKYGDDPNERETLKTQLNVFERFSPDIPSEYRQTPYVFLGNIDPSLQLEVLNQMKGTRIFVATDTMNFWIQRKRGELEAVLKKTDLFMINHQEARLLTKTYNLIKAAREISKLGPKLIIIKQGEHGAFLIKFYDSSKKFKIFKATGFPIEEVIDPTGAGDSFAGGFIGYLARVRNFSFSVLKNAVILGNILASFCVQDFGIERFKTLKREEILERMKMFKEYTHFKYDPIAVR
jgi:sugar/nucleoside kinase (ribokinase family)